MKIITDNIDFAIKYGYGEPEDYSVISDFDLQKLSEHIFGNKKNLWFFNDTNTKFWDYLFIIEHAEESQYDLMISIAQHKNIPDKMLCVAGSGNKFHGFHSRKWEALPGNIHLTAYLKPNLKIQNFAAGFLILSAISVVQTIDQILPLKNKSSIKWVNDILIHNAKVSGVLAHALSRADIVTDAILGIGLNVESKPNIEPTPFVPESACLNDFLDANIKIEIKDIFTLLLNHLSKNYKILCEGNFETLLKIYKDTLTVFDKDVIVMSDERDGTSKFICEGKVSGLGNNLEILLECKKEPITSGRLIMKTGNNY